MPIKQVFDTSIYVYIYYTKRVYRNYGRISVNCTCMCVRELKRCEKRTELRIVKIRRTVTKRQKFLLTGSKNNYPAERRHISCNYRTTRVRRVNIIARMRPDGIYTEDTHTYTHTYTRTQCDNSTNSYTDSAISTP